jgi:hypothetical protein
MKCWSLVVHLIVAHLSNQHDDCSVGDIDQEQASQAMMQWEWQGLET